MKLKLTDENFGTEVYCYQGVVLVEFFARWCRTCAMMRPLVEEVAEIYKEELKFGEVDVDDCEMLAAKYETELVPTLILFRDGQVVGRAAGSLSEASIWDMIEDNL